MEQSDVQLTYKLSIPRYILTQRKHKESTVFQEKPILMPTVSI